MAIVHEWLSSRAGSEKVFESFAQTFPDADLFALTIEPSVQFAISRPVRTTWLQSHGILRQRRGMTLPLMPLAWRTLKTNAYDVVLTSSHAFARYFPAPAKLHLSYIHTPLRYAWLPEIDGRGSGPWLAPARAALRAADRKSVAWVTDFAANSTATAARIEAFYGRSARVIPPPVDVTGFTPAEDGHRDSYLLGVSRWIPYKRLDLVIKVAEQLQMPAVIAGRGPMRDELERLASSASVEVRVVHSPSDAELRELYQRAACLVFPAVEDFGIIPVEAQACGTPVAAVAEGGSLDTVVEGVTGSLAPDQSVEALSLAVERCLEIVKRDQGAIRRHALTFSEDLFKERIREWVSSAVNSLPPGVADPRPS